MGKERRLAREQVYPVLLRGSCSVHQREGCAHRYPVRGLYVSRSWSIDRRNKRCTRWSVSNEKLRRTWESNVRNWVRRRKRKKKKEKKERRKRERKGERKKDLSSVKNFDNHSGKLEEIVRSIVSKQRRERNRQSVARIAERDRLLVNRQRIGACGQWSHVRAVRKVSSSIIKADCSAARVSSPIIGAGQVDTSCRGKRSSLRRRDWHDSPGPNDLPLYRETVRCGVSVLTAAKDATARCETRSTEKERIYNTNFPLCLPLINDSFER